MSLRVTMSILQSRGEQIAIPAFKHSLVLLPLFLASSILAQSAPAFTPQQLFQQERWPEVVRMLQAVRDRSPEMEYQFGIALAHLEQWDAARDAFIRGSRLQPRDKRFPIELAGVAFKQKNNRQAVLYLRRALRVDPKDDYANEFLAAVYFLQGNSEAAVKYWNRLPAPKPQIADLRNEPPLRVRPALLDHAFAFSPAGTLKLRDLWATQARVHALEIFPTNRMDLVARPDGKFDSVFRAQELNGFGNTKVEALLRIFRGLPFQEITLEYYNLNGSAINFSSLARWDSDKRRYLLSLSGPVRHNPQWRYRLGGEVRNENWDVRNGFTGPAPVLASLNLRREEFSGEIARLIGWRWRWSLGAEISHRGYRNVVPGTTLTPQLLSSGYQLKQTAGLGYELWRSPERRMNISSGINSQAARTLSNPNQSFAKLQASLEAHWFPRATGDDLETHWRLRDGKTFGQVSFDELFMLGLERDNDLWMRAHIGARDGRKGSAPLGQDYFLSNWETDKNVYSNGFLTVKLGPFLDTGKITDHDSAFGSHKWLWDTGVQAKVRALGVGAVFSYGKDLRTGNNAFYVTVAR